MEGRRNRFGSWEKALVLLKIWEGEKSHSSGAALSAVVERCEYNLSYRIRQLVARDTRKERERRRKEVSAKKVRRWELGKTRDSWLNIENSGPG